MPGDASTGCQGAADRPERGAPRAAARRHRLGAGVRQVAAKEEGSVLAVRDPGPLPPRLAARVPQIGPKEERRVLRHASDGLRAEVRCTGRSVDGLG